MSASELYSSEKHSVNKTVNTPELLRDRYQFLEKLGSGTQGNVYKAVRLSDNKIVAIKRLRIDSVNTWKEYDLFHREAEVLSKIHEHGVAEFYDAIESLKSNPPEAYIVQELIEGRSLQLMLKTGFRFTVSRIFKMALDMVGLLERLHAHNPPVIHRDIKPNNIIMKPMQNADDFEPYLIDFGAVANPTVQKGGSTVAGTYGYMPPEQLVGRPVPSSDIYSLGTTIVYMLTGVEPADMRVADFRLIIDPYLENVPRPVVTVLHQMLDPKPETRLCDYQRLKEIFTEFSNDIYTENEQDALQSPDLINKKLSQVNAFNQAGNLDLWMQLPERMPRQVPASFADTILNLEDENRARLIKEKLRLPVIRFSVCFGIFLIPLLTVISGDSDGEGVLWLILFIVVAFCVSAVFAVDLFSKLASIRQIKKDKIERLQMYSAISSENELIVNMDKLSYEDLPMLTLLKFGRKAIATIVDFEDMPIPQKYRKFNMFRKEIISEAHVPFRLRYRFNPPDDACADDLVHEITIYNHQTEGLEEGTPIPILYYINPDDNSDVMSMPYPFPFKEIENTQVTLVNKDKLYARTIGVR